VNNEPLLEKLENHDDLAQKTLDLQLVEGLSLVANCFKVAVWKMLKQNVLEVIAHELAVVVSD
jgi:hypothetical protein